MYVFVGTPTISWSIFRAYVLAEDWDEQEDAMVDIVKRFGTRISEEEARERLKENPVMYHDWKNVPYRR